MKIVSSWANFFYTIFSLLLVFILFLHIQFNFLNNLTVSALAFIALMLTFSQLAFSFRMEGKTDYFAFLSAMNLLFVFITYFYEIVLSNNYQTHLVPWMFDIAILLSVLSIAFIWLSSEGFLNLQQYITRRRKKKELEEKVEEDVPSSDEDIIELVENKETTAAV